ncbi:hypothetical protein QQX13_10110 [Demequina sp. SYSU T00068]|uniref:hypothetical protein n=1 Tax=Demequina lignilytica TaxID=3051663 RepID=UPI00263A12D4|nr:hypothetical protein [Demequina sp. SYSU T00068]MDN4491186.1 hypothetical protein [Demequina sp. SYSU T00068]
MGGTFNDQMMADNERGRTRAESGAAPAVTLTETQPAPRTSRRFGTTVVSMMVVFAAMVLFASALGGTFELQGSDGATVAISGGPATQADADGVPLVSWTAGGFAFDTPEGWTVDAADADGVVRVLTADGGLIEILEAGRWSGGSDPMDHAFDAAYRLYLDRIGFVDELTGAAYDSPYADSAIVVRGATGRVAVMIGADGSVWAAVDHRAPGGLEAGSWQVLLTSVRPA